MSHQKELEEIIKLQDKLSSKEIEKKLREHAKRTYLRVLKAVNEIGIAEGIEPYSFGSLLQAIGERLQEIDPCQCENCRKESDRILDS